MAGTEPNADQPKNTARGRPRKERPLTGADRARMSRDRRNEYVRQIEADLALYRELYGPLPR
jgi:hypothetical protein